MTTRQCGNGLCTPK